MKWGDWQGVVQQFGGRMVCFRPKICDRMTAQSGEDMTLLTLQNPVFVTYAIAAALTVLKIMLQGWLTVYRMLVSDSGLASPEDVQKGLINRNPRAEQLEVND